MPDFYTPKELYAFAARIACKPLRTCKTLHFCELCKRYIELGEEYYDGGHSARAHKGCVDISAINKAKEAKAGD